MLRIPPVLALASLLAIAAPGQDAGSSPRLERFELFNACRPMALVVESLNDDAGKIGLSKDTLQAAAESRLRAARLYAEDFEKTYGSYLYVNVNVVGRAVSARVHYQKPVTDEFGVLSLTTTWYTGIVGMASDASYIVQVLSQLLDEFLAAFLRVNEEACESAPQ